MSYLHQKFVRKKLNRKDRIKNKFITITTTNLLEKFCSLENDRNEHFS